MSDNKTLYHVRTKGGQDKVYNESDFQSKNVAKWLEDNYQPGDYTIEQEVVNPTSSYEVKTNSGQSKVYTGEEYLKNAGTINDNFAASGYEVSPVSKGPGADGTFEDEPMPQLKSYPQRRIKPVEKPEKGGDYSGVKDWGQELANYMGKYSTGVAKEVRRQQEDTGAVQKPSQAAAELEGRIAREKEATPEKYHMVRSEDGKSMYYLDNDQLAERVKGLVPEGMDPTSAEALAYAREHGLAYDGIYEDKDFAIRDERRRRQRLWEHPEEDEAGFYRIIEADGYKDIPYSEYAANPDKYYATPDRTVERWYMGEHPVEVTPEQDFYRLDDAVKAFDQKHAKEMADLQAQLDIYHLQESSNGNVPRRLREAALTAQQRLSELQTERGKLTRARYDNPVRVEMEQSINGANNKLRESINESLGEATSNKLAAAAENPMLAATMAGDMTTGTTPVTTPEEDNYNAALRLLNDADKAMRAPGEYSKGGFFQQRLRGAADVLSDPDFWTDGFTAIADGLNLNTTLKKIQDSGSKLTPEAIEAGDFEKILSPDEKALVDAWVQNTLAQNYKNEYDPTSNGYRAAQSAVESLKFMAEFLLTGGVARAAQNAVVKGATKGAVSTMDDAAEALAKRWARKFGQMGIDDAGRAAGRSNAVLGKIGSVLGKEVVDGTRRATASIIQTGLMPSTLVNQVERMNQVTDSGELVDTAKAMSTGFWDQVVENYSEQFGEVLGGLTGGFGNAVFGNVVKKLNAAPVAKLLKDAGFHGYFGEIGEEIAGAAIRDITKLDANAWEDFWDKDNLAVVMESFLPMSLFGLGSSAVQLRKRQNNYNKAKADLENDPALQGEVGQRWLADVEENFLTKTPNELFSNDNEALRQVLADAGPNEELARKIVDYAKASAEYAMFREYDEEERDRSLEATRAEKAEQYGDNIFRTEQVEDGFGGTQPQEYVDVVQVSTDSGVSEAYVVSDTAENGDVAVVLRDPKTGQQARRVVSPDQIADRRKVSAKDWLSGEQVRRKSDEERQRMAQEARQFAADVKAAAQTDPAVQHMQGETPVAGTVTRINPDGVVVQYNEPVTINGQTKAVHSLSWKEFAAEKGMQFEPSTDEQIEQRKAHVADMKDQQRRALNMVAKGKNFQGPDGGNYRLVLAIPDEQNSEEDNGQVSLLVYDMNERGRQKTITVPYASVAGQFGVAERDYGALTIDDFQGDEGAMYQTAPESWARYNDEQRQDDGMSSIQQLSASLEDLDRQIAVATEARDATSDVEERRMQEAKIAEAGDRANTLRAVLTSYSTNQLQAAGVDTASLVAQSVAAAEAYQQARDAFAQQNGIVLQDNATSAPAAEEAEQEIPREQRADGTPGRKLYHTVPVATTLNDIYKNVENGSISEEEVQQLIDANQETARKELEALEKAKPVMGDDVEAYVQAKQEYADKVAEQQAVLKYWDEVRNQSVTGRQMANVRSFEQRDAEMRSEKHVGDVKTWVDNAKAQAGTSGDYRLLTVENYGSTLDAERDARLQEMAAAGASEEEMQQERARSDAEKAAIDRNVNLINEARKFGINLVMGGEQTGGKITIFADNIFSEEEAATTFRHENRHLQNEQEMAAAATPEQRAGTLVGRIVAAAGNDADALADIVAGLSGNSAYEHKRRQAKNPNLSEGSRMRALETLADELSAFALESGELDEEKLRKVGRNHAESTENIINAIKSYGTERQSASDSNPDSRADEDAYADASVSGTENGGNPELESREVGEQGYGSPRGGTEELRSEVSGAEALAESAGISTETAEELIAQGRTMEDGLVLNEQTKALKDETGYLTPNQVDTNFSVVTLPAWAKNYMQQPGAEQRVVDALEAWRDRALVDELVSGVISQGEHPETYFKGGVRSKGKDAGPLRTNVEYVITFDMDTTCPRTFQFLSIAEQIESQLGRPLTQHEAIQLIELMRAYGVQIPCVYCYAENKRQALKQYYADFMTARQGVLGAKTRAKALEKMYGHLTTKEAKASTDPDVALTKAGAAVFKNWWKNRETLYNPTLKQLWAEYKRARNSILSLLDDMLDTRKVSLKNKDSYLVDKVADALGINATPAKRVIEEIVTEWKWDRIENLPHADFTRVSEEAASANQDALNLWREMTAYGKSASSAKSKYRFVPYTDELKFISKADRDYINGMGGLRMHSTNDFRIDYVLDYFQFMADMAQAGMMGHTYTKSEEFVRIFGNSGYKINMSIAAYQDENGNIVENVDEGFPWELAKELRSLYPNAGVMLMATSDEQIQMALDSDWIDMFIPFHNSGLAQAIWRDMRGWTDYTNTQNEAFYNADDMIAVMDREGIDYPRDKKGNCALKSDELKEYFIKKAGIKVMRDSDGKRIRPHFLPGPTKVGKYNIPGWHRDEDPENDLKRYFSYCREYGVRPRFMGVKVKDAEGNTIDITEHPGYIKCIKETARMETPQTPIQFNFDQPSTDPLLEGKSPLEWSLDELRRRAQMEQGLSRDGKVSTIYDSAKQDLYGIAPKFLESYVRYHDETGKERPLDYLPDDAREWFLTERSAVAQAFKDAQYIPYHRYEYDEDGNVVDKTAFRTVYHGSAADFERFDHSHMGEGEGNQAYGWGTYVASNPDVANEYAVRFGEPGNRHLYTVEIPEDNGQNYIHWDEPLTEEQSRKIMDAVRERADKDSWGDEFEYELQSSLGPGTYGRFVEGALDYFLGNEYNYATDENPGAKRNAELLNSVGIVGIEIPMERGGVLPGSDFVIFNEDDLVITDNTRFSVVNALQKKPVGATAESPVVTDADVLEDTMFRLTKNNRATVEAWLKKRSDINEGQRKELVEYIDGLEDAKTQLATAKWFANGTVRLPEDMPKIEQAVSVAEKAKVDPLQYASPMALMDAHADFRPTRKRIDPDTVPTLHKAAEYPEGITVYDVDEGKKSRENMREIINTHFGEDASPWCLLQGDGQGNLTADSARYWKHYNSYPKQVAFKDGKLLAFSANDSDVRLWWDRQDESHYGIPVSKKMEGDELGRSVSHILLPPGFSEEDGSSTRPAWWEVEDEGEIPAVPANETDEAKFVPEPGAHPFKGNRQNGTYEEWSMDGSVLLERKHYKNGREDGLQKTWYPSGQPQHQYSKKDGQYDGEYITWFENGGMRLRNSFRNGMKDGLEEQWYSNGQKRFERRYDNGIPVGETVIWNSDGTLAQKNFYSATGEYEGVEEYDLAGRLIRRVNYIQTDDGEMRVEERINRNGIVTERKRTLDGALWGMQESFNSDGQLLEAMNWRNGVSDGPAERYHPNGQIWVRGNFSNGDLDGVFEEWNRAGELINRAVYDHNRLVEGEALNAYFRVTVKDEAQQEKDVIKATAYVNGTFMKAPNGQDTNLTEDQWLTVRTQAFKNWFGDWENEPENASKVVDENGEPRVVYHGTRWKPLEEEPGKAVFDVDRVGENFDFVDIDWNFFFTASEASARGYGNAVPVFLNIRTPEVHTIREEVLYEMDEEIGHDIVVNAHDAGSENDTVTKVENPDGVMYTIRAVDITEADRKFSEAIKEWEGEHKQELEDEYNSLKDQRDSIIKQLEDARRDLYDQMGFAEVFWTGYDEMKKRSNYVLDEMIDSAAKMRNISTENIEALEAQYNDVDQKMFKIFRRVDIEGRPEYEDYQGDEVERDYHDTDMFALDDPNQIKSAVENTGEFSTENDDIRFRVTPEQDAEYMDAVKAGDMEKAQQMVNTAAEAVMPNSKVRGEDGKLKVVYHGTPWGGFSVFRAGNGDDHPIYFAAQEKMARSFADAHNGEEEEFEKSGDPLRPKVYRAYLNIENPVELGRISIAGDDYAERWSKEFGVPREEIEKNIKSPEWAVGYEMLDGEKWINKLILNSGHDGFHGWENDEVRGEQWGVYSPSQIKSAEPVTYDAAGNVVPLSERFNPKSNDIRFRLANAHEDMFISNAQQAVEGLNMGKASGEQWLKAIQGRGGLKAGEDKWLGLSDWLKGREKPVTKQEVLDYIAENRVQIEEQRYTEGAEKSYADAIASYQKEYLQLVDEGEEAGEYNAFEYAYDQMIERYGDDFGMAFYRDGNTITPAYDYGDGLADAAQYFLDQRREDADVRGINPTRLGYTTEGLTNKREIALTVPTIEPWNESDKIHFGDAGEGRAIAWARFGDTWASKAKDEARERYLEADKAWRDYRDEVIAKYALKATDTKKTRDLATPEENAKVQALLVEALRLKDEWQFGRHPREKVLVIDEIQSKRHQEGREKGYETPEAKERLTQQYLEAKKEHDAFEQRMAEKYADRSHGRRGWVVWMDEQEKEEKRNLFAKMESARQKTVRSGLIPTAPFEKNWHELAMKRMLRLAAEEGYDFVAWTTGDQQTERYSLSKNFESVERDDLDEDSEERRFIFHGKDEGGSIAFIVDNDGNIIKGQGIEGVDGKRLSEVVGKELAVKLMEMDDYDELESDDIRIGGEGMKGFYDSILPSFMNKYGKKWGVKVEDKTLPGIGENGREGLTMHSIAVTPEMKESVLEGQTMFRIGYHAGDLGVARDTYRDAMDGTRSTGHFGTGTYFVGDERAISYGQYANRPHQTVELDEYNLFRPATARQAEVLHEALKRVNNSIATYPEDWPQSTQEYFDNCHALIHEKYAETPDLEKVRKIAEPVLGKEKVDKMLAGENGVGEILEEYSQKKDFFFRGVLDYVQRGADIDDAAFDLWRAGVGSLSRVKDAIIKARDAYRSDRDGSQDSASTIVMKELGYNGIDVTGIEGMDNTTFGTVVYDLDDKKPQDVDTIGETGFRVVTDPALLEELENGETIKVYRAMQLVDGKLYPPMSGKVDGEWRNPIELGAWEQAEERPDLVIPDIDKETGKQKVDELGNPKWKFRLDKGNDSTVDAAYNPYFHTSDTPLNDQFSSAQTRPELVTVEVEIPVSELESGYKAEKAKDAVGKLEWKAGPVQGKLTGTRTVYLSRWDKPVRIVPDSEVADRIVEMLDGRRVYFPSNTTTPSLRAELEQRGVRFVETDNQGNSTGMYSPETYKEMREVGKKAREKKKFMLAPNGQPTNLTEEQWELVRTRAFKNWFGDWEKDPAGASKVLDENGEPMVVYHGTHTYGFTEFAQPGENLQGLIWLTDQKRYAEVYADYGYEDDTQGVYSLFADIKNPLDLGYIEDVVGSDAWNGIAEKLSMTPKELYDRLNPFENTPYHDAVEHMSYIYDYTREAEFANLLKEKGYDGAFALEEGVNKTPTYAAVNPGQVKSATANNGEYSESDDIRFRTAALESNYDGKWKDGEFTYVGPKVQEGTPEAEMLDYIMGTLNEYYHGETPWEAIGYVHNYISDMPQEVPTWTEEAANKFQPEMFLSRKQLATENQTRTEAFKRWFGDWENDPEGASKVVDEDGKPLVVYHGTRQGRFTKFKETNHGIFFTDDPGVADDYAYYDNEYGEDDEDAMVVDAYLDIKKPFVIDADYYDWKTLPDSYNGLNSGSNTTDGWARYLMESHPEYDGLIVRNVSDGYGRDEITTVYAVFKPNQIKSATGNNGSFSRRNSDINFRVINEQDQEYMAAVEAGDMDKAQQMVRDASKAAFPDTKVVDENGDPKVVYKRQQQNHNILDTSGWGSFFSEEPIADKSFGSVVTRAYLNFENPLVVDAQGNSWSRPLWLELTDENGELIPREQLRDRVGDGLFGLPYEVWEHIYDDSTEYEFDMIGRIVRDLNLPYDGVIINNISEGSDSNQEMTDYVALYPNQIKSADPVTYDDQGNVIPLSRRFDLFEDDIRFRFIGDNGVMRLETSWAEAPDGTKMATIGAERWKNRRIANEMKEAGRPADEIKWATGWEVGADGKWRHEEPDFTMSDLGELKKGETKKLDDFLHDDDLFKAYPKFKDIKVTTMKSATTNGAYNHQAKTLELNERFFDKNGKVTDPAIIRTLVHEIQHAIQHEEGFAVGANTENIFDTELYDDAKRNIPDVLDFVELFWNGSAIDDFKNTSPHGVAAVIDAQISRLPSKEAREAAERTRDRLRQMNSTSEFNNFLWRAKGLRNALKRAARKAYEYSAGEEEARNAAIRSGLSMNGRRSTLAEVTETIPRDQQIVRFDNVISKALEPGADPLGADARGTLMRVYNALPEAGRDEVIGLVPKNGFDFSKATGEYIGSLAEKETLSEEERKAAAIARDEICNTLGIEPVMTTGEARMILWDASHNLNDPVDLARRQVLARRLGADEASRQERRELRGDANFRIAMHEFTGSAANFYNREVTWLRSMLNEAHVDMNASVNILMDAIEKQTGAKADSFEDVRLALNQLSSKIMADKVAYERDYLNPMRDAIEELIKTAGLTYQDVVEYTMKKHGLERNIVFARRDAIEDYKKIHDDTVKAIKNNPELSKDEKDEAIAEADKRLEKRTKDVENSVDDPEATKAYAAAMDEWKTEKERIKRLDLTPEERSDEFDRARNDFYAKVRSISSSYGADGKFLEHRLNDYSGIMSWYTTGPEIEKMDTESEEEFRKRYAESRSDMYDTLWDAEERAREDVSDVERAGRGTTGDLWSAINAATRRNLEMREERGLISASTRKNMAKMFQYYVPLKGFAEETAGDVYSYYGKNVTPDLNVAIKHAKGRHSKAESPFGYIANEAESVIQAGDKNQAKQTLYFFIANRPQQDLVSVSEQWYVRDGVDDMGREKWVASYPDFREGMTAGEIADAVRDHEQRMIAMGPDAMKRNQRLDLGKSVVFVEPAAVNQHAVKVTVNGKDYVMYINGNPRAAQAINGTLNADEGGRNPLVDMTGSWLRWLSNVSTSFNPEFWISNFQRDFIFSRMKMDTSGTPEMKDAFRRGYWTVAKNTARLMKAYNRGELGHGYLEDLYRDFAENGGITGYTVLGKQKEYEKKFNDYFAKEDKKVVKAAKAVFDYIQETGESIEQITRFAAFVAAREAGKDVTEAVSWAKEISVNFNRKGSGIIYTPEQIEKMRDRNGKELNPLEKRLALIALNASGVGRSMFMFYNAAIQGLKNYANMFKDSKGKTAKWAGVLFGVGFLNALVHAWLDDPDDDKGYFSMTDFTRRTNLLLGGNHYYLKWALPQEARVFYAAGDMLAGKLLGRSEDEKAFMELGRMIADLLPLGSAAGDTAGNFIPAQIGPLYETLVNKDFTGSAIYSDFPGSETKAAYKTAKASTNPVYVTISKAVNDATKKGYEEIGWWEHTEVGRWINTPGVMEHLIEGYTGGVGTSIGKLLETVTGAGRMGAALAKGMPFEQAVEYLPSIRRVPFLSRVVASNARGEDGWARSMYYYYKSISDEAGNSEKSLKLRDEQTAAALAANPDDEKAIRERERYEKDQAAYDASYDKKVRDAVVAFEKDKEVKANTKAIREQEPGPAKEQLLEERGELRRRLIDELDPPVDISLKHNR